MHVAITGAYCGHPVGGCPGAGQGSGGGVEKPEPVMMLRLLTLSDAAEVCGTTKKALERRVERGSLEVSCRGGVRVVDVPELVRAGLLAPDATPMLPAPVSALERPLAVLARRVAEADADLVDLRATLVATEAALQRARAEARVLRMRLARVSPAPAEMLAGTA